MTVILYHSSSLWVDQVTSTKFWSPKAFALPGVAYSPLLMIRLESLKENALAHYDERVNYNQNVS